MRLFVCLVLAAGEIPACLSIDGERIRAGDIAVSVPAFVTVKPDQDLGPAPSPGVKRVLSRAQLARLAAAEGVSSEGLPESLCLERHQNLLDPAAVLVALEHATRELFPAEEIRVEMLDYIRYPLPPGTLSFRRQGVFGGSGKAIDAPLLWRGTLTTNEKRSLPVWAKAKILAFRRCWSAKEDLIAGAQPSEEKFTHSERWLNPFLSAASCADPRDKALRLRRPLRSGQLLLQSDLATVPPVRRGESVQASLEIASATLSFDAVSEMDGADGQSVFVKRDGRRLRARVTGAGAVQIIPGDSK